jgi:hypothetical protein
VANIVLRFPTSPEGHAPLRLLLDREQILGSIEACICSSVRFERGHLPTCPLAGYPPQVVALDTGAADRVLRRVY